MNSKSGQAGLMFSIIVPTYNEEKDIFRTLQALEIVQKYSFEEDIHGIKRALGSL